MAKGALVSIDLDIGDEVLKILDSADLSVKVAAWVLLEYYDSGRLVLASRQFDEVGEWEGAGLVLEALRKAGLAAHKRPSFMILPMKDPFIRDLRRKRGKLRVMEGLRLGPETLGDWFIEDGYAYRIS